MGEEGGGGGGGEGGREGGRGGGRGGGGEVLKRVDVSACALNKLANGLS